MDHAPASAPRQKSWGRLVIALVVLLPLLWWAGVRLQYFNWLKHHGFDPQRQTDFTQLPRVLPPADATLSAIYPGLPHQYWEPGKLILKLFTTSNRSIGGYRFYTTSLVAPEALRASLSIALRAPALYIPYSGPKQCGGYHPDYAFKWDSSRGPYYALLCTGCHEMILIGDGTEVHCDMRNQPFAALEQLLEKLGK